MQWCGQVDMSARAASMDQDDDVVHIFRRSKDVHMHQLLCHSYAFCSSQKIFFNANEDFELVS
jgi:hypothetical protein